MFKNVVKYSVLIFLSISFLAIADQVEEARSHLIQSVKLAKQEKYSEALQEVDQAMAVDPDHPYAQAVKEKIQSLMKQSRSGEEIKNSVTTKGGTNIKTKGGKPVTLKK